MFQANCFTDVISLYYDPRYNWFEDEEGNIVSSIFEIITSDALHLFHENQEYMIVPHNQFKDIGVELHYPSEGDCYYCEYYDDCHSDGGTV